MFFGYLPDPVDDRDWDFNKLRVTKTGSTLVEKIDWRVQVPDILDQLSLGSCVAQGVAGAIRLKNLFNGVTDPKLANRLHIYAGARGYIKTLDQDSGSHIRNAFRFINKVGFMPEDETDNNHDITKYQELPKPHEMRLMFDQRDTGEKIDYYRITDRGDARESALKQAMSFGGIPVLGTQTTKDFLNYKSGILPKPSKDQKTTGGHAFYLAGYTPSYVIVANSWGAKWGMDGFAYLSWDYIKWSQTQDIWVVDKAPYFSHLRAA